MTHADLIRTASRVLAIYFVFIAATHASYVPQEVVGVLNQRHLATLSQTAYVRQSNASSAATYTGLAIGNLLGTVFWALVAGWFFRCGGLVRRLLGQAEAEPAEQRHAN